MDKNSIEDGMYKIVYKLPLQSIFEFDLYLKKNENFETVMHETFEQEQIPKIFMDDISILMTQFIIEERRAKPALNSTQLENLNSKVFIQNAINIWLTNQTFRNHITCIILCYC
jgi:glutaredoxin